MSSLAIACSLLAVMSAVLILHPRYEDGVIGRVFLGGVVLAGVIIVVSELHGAVRYSASPEIDMLIWCFLGFQARHCYRFFRALKDPGKYGWGGAVK